MQAPRSLSWPPPCPLPIGQRLHGDWSPFQQQQVDWRRVPGGRSLSLLGNGMKNLLSGNHQWEGGWSRINSFGFGTYFGPPPTRNGSECRGDEAAGWGSSVCGSRRLADTVSGSSHLPRFWLWGLWKQWNVGAGSGGRGSRRGGRRQILRQMQPETGRRRPEGQHSGWGGEGRVTLPLNSTRLLDRH